MSRETFKMRGFLILKNGDNHCLSELSWRVRRKYAYSNYRGMKNTVDSQYIGLNDKLGFFCSPISGIWCPQGLGNAVPTWKAVGVSFSVRSCSQFFQTGKLSHRMCPLCGPKWRRQQAVCPKSFSSWCSPPRHSLGSWRGCKCFDTNPF